MSYEEAERRRALIMLLIAAVLLAVVFTYAILWSFANNPVLLP